MPKENRIPKYIQIAGKTRKTEPHGENAHPCLLSTLPPDVQRRMRRLFLSGRNGLIEEPKDVLFKLSSLAEEQPAQNLTKYGELILKAISTIYGQKL